MAVTQGGGNLVSYELGDALYRENGFGLIEGLGHGAIGYEADLQGNQRVIEVYSQAAIIGGVHTTSFASFKNVAPYWGAYRPGTLAQRPETFSERISITDYAFTLDALDPDYPFLGGKCLDPIFLPGSRVNPFEIQDLRCDGLVEYCYEYLNRFPVWGKGGANYDISLYWVEHNDLFNGYSWNDPNTELAPVVQCNLVPGTWATNMFLPAVVDGPQVQFAETVNETNVVISVTCSDQSGINRIEYKWGSGGDVTGILYATLHSFEVRQISTTSSGTLYVRARDGAGNMGSWAYVYVDVNSPPGSPSSPSPWDGQATVDIGQNLDWNCTDPDNDTLYYTVWLSKGNSNFSSGEIIKSDSPGSSASPGIMDYDSHYYWKVQADDHNGGVTTVSHWDFYTQFGPPATPASISYPTTDCDGAYTVSWGASNGASSYQLERSTNGGSWSVIFTGPGTSYGESVAAGAFRYRVRASNDAGQSGYRTGLYDCLVSSPPTPPTSVTCTPSSYCLGWPPPMLTLTANGGSGDNLKWYAESDLTSHYLGQGSPLVAYAPDSIPAIGFWVIEARWESACGASDPTSTNVYVSPVPEASPSSNSPVCEGETLYLGSPISHLDAYYWTGPNGYECSSATTSSCSRWFADPSMTGLYTLITEYEGCLSEPVSIWVEVLPLPDEQAINIAPIAGDSFVSPVSALEWQPVPDATSYDVYWGYSNPPPFWQNVVSTTASPPSVENRQYYWQVVAKNDVCGSGPAGPIWSYSTDAVPVINESQKLLASDGVLRDRFGLSLGISPGTTIVGAPTIVVDGTETGSAYLISTSSGQEFFKLEALADGAPGDFFGFSCAVSDSLAAVGAPWDDAAGNNAGAVYIFDVTTGQKLLKLTAPDGGAQNQFGYSVSMHGDLVLVGAPNDNALTGSAYIFNGATGALVHKLTADDGAPQDKLGQAVSLHGGLALVGAAEDQDNGPRSGSAYVFDAGTGAQVRKLAPMDGTDSDYFGCSVSLSGGLALIGAKLDDDQGADSGSAYLFDVISGQELKKLTAPDGADNDQFGRVVFLSGRHALVGSHWNDDACPSNPTCDSGAAYVFDAHTGFVLHKLRASDEDPTNILGFSVALADGRAVVGAPSDDDLGGDSGSVYVFDVPNSGPGTGYCIGAPGVGTPCPCDNDGTLAIAGCANGVNNSGGQLLGSGAASLTMDSLRLTATGLEPGQPGIFFQGNNQIADGVPFGDGLMCAGASVKRLWVITSSASGYSSTSGSMPSISVKAGNVSPGETKYYQYWYRSPTPLVCGVSSAGFNLTNGYAVTWLP